MIIRQSNLFTSNSKPAIGQKVVVIRNNNKIYALPIGYNGNSFTVLNTDFFGNENDISYVNGNNVKIAADNIISISSQKLVYNGLNLNTLLNVNHPYGLLQLNSYNKIDSKFLPENYNPIGSDSSDSSDNSCATLDFDILSFASSITLPVPQIENSDILNLIVDISYSGQFNDNDNNEPIDYYRISMKNSQHREIMKLFYNNNFINIPDNGLDQTYSQCTVTFTLDENIFPNYQKGNLYTARYSWIKNDTEYLSWKGFKFTGDVTELSYPQNNAKLPQNIVLLNSNNKIQQNILPYEIPYPTFTLPVPYDQNNDNITLIIDISETGQFIQEESSSSNSSESSYNFQFTRISMKNSNHRQYMKIFENNQFVDIPQSGVGLDHYGQNVVVTLNNTIFPNYIKGKTYYARYTWMDINGAYTDWKGFKFSNDVSDLAKNENKVSKQLSFYQKDITSSDIDENNNLIEIDYLNGEVQYLKFDDNFNNTTNIVIDVDNVNNIPYGKSLKIILYKGQTLNSYNLTLIGQQDNEETYSNQSKVMIQISNYSYQIIKVDKII